MPIKFHCSHCGKKIEAPDQAGGKWGKCPACHNKVYVPQPQSPDEDELKLAPLDQTEEQRQRQLMRETLELQRSILEERNVPESQTTGPTPTISEEQLMNHIIRYLRLMADGDLDEAQRVAGLITPHRRKAIPILDRISLSDVPEPELQDIPKQVLSGLIRNLRTRIS